MQITKGEVTRYSTLLVDKSRPPSRGGNKKAWHRHVLIIDGETYSFLAAWSGKFVYASETVSFDWEFDPTGRYRNVSVATIVAHTAKGEDVRRGDRGGKVWRTAETRLPARRSEWKD